MQSFLWLGAATLLLLGCGSDESTATSGGGAGASSGTPTSTGASTATGTGTGGAGATGGGGASATGGGGGAAPCNPACSGGLECCDGLCVNKGNDIKNCGTCGTVCPSPNPFCNGGTCGQPPCEPGTTCKGTASCCGSSCCDLGMLCCVVPAGPVGPPECVAPNEHGTCDPGCPACVCASPDTPIATPGGDRPIADLAVGDLVYSVDGGVVKVVPIVAVNRVRVEGHHVVRLGLSNGSVLEISARHPTADGSSFGDLRVGDDLHGVTVTEVATVPYLHEQTYDILPGSDSGAYFAGGALVGSTLKKSPARIPESCLAPGR